MPTTQRQLTIKAYACTIAAGLLGVMAAACVIGSLFSPHHLDAGLMGAGILFGASAFTMRIKGYIADLGSYWEQAYLMGVEVGEERAQANHLRPLR